MDEENVFLSGGVLKNSTEFLAALGVYDYFWALSPEIRSKIISSWKKSPDFLEGAHLEMDFFDVDDEYGSMAILTDEEPVEVIKYTDNVVPFKR